MIYGYSSKLAAYGIDTIMDYGRAFMEELKLVRRSAAVSNALPFLVTEAYLEIYTGNSTTYILHRP
jgi:hypothetical protein